MGSFRKLLLACAYALPLAGVAALPAHAGDGPRFQHVLLVSVDGMHAVDLARYLQRPGASTLKRLSRHGTQFPNAYTTAPSDSFPGMVAQVTGASPKTAGVFYDDSYDRTFFAPGSGCAGDAGAETTYAENIDYTLDRIDGGGQLGQPLTQINPANLPLHLVDGACLPVIPHEFIRANTVFEIAKEAGLRTAWADKHPAYEILNGPSGHGIDDLYTPEINSIVPGQSDGKTGDYTTGFASVRQYDDTHVQAVLNEINGLNSLGTAPAPVPAIFGCNFQAVSVGQKLAKSGTFDPPGLVGGYTDSNATPGNALAQQLDYVDQSLGRMVAALDQQHLTRSTLVIVSAKHGQSPIDVSTRVAVDDAPYAKTPGYGFHIADDEALLWLKPQTRTPAVYAQARSYLKANADTLHIAQLLGQASLKNLYQDPRTDSRTPDFVAVSQHGVIYTGGSKLSEHGGFSTDDRNVALLVSAPSLPGTVDENPVETKQIAPTILTALGLDPAKLVGVQREGTQALPTP